MRSGLIILYRWVTYRNRDGLCTSEPCRLLIMVMDVKHCQSHWSSLTEVLMNYNNNWYDYSWNGIVPRYLCWWIREGNNDLLLIQHQWRHDTRFQHANNTNTHIGSEMDIINCIMISSSVRYILLSNAKGLILYWLTIIIIVVVSHRFIIYRIVWTGVISIELIRQQYGTFRFWPWCFCTYRNRDGRYCLCVSSSL